MPRIDLSIAGNQPEGVRLLGACIRQLALLTFNEEHAAEVEVAMVEAVTNSMRHAQIGDTDIKVRFALAKGGVEIDLFDEGQPLDPSILESRDHALEFDPSDIQNLPVGGMGLIIIKNYMNEVSYRFENGRNHWKFSKYPCPNGTGTAPATAG